MRFQIRDEENPIQGLLLRAAAEKGELSIPALRALSPLSDKAQVLVDKAVVNVGLQRLVIAADLLSSGLTFPLTDPLSVTEVEWEAISKVGGAQRTMSPSARGENQLPDRIIHRVPIFCTTDDFSIGIRTLKMSQRVGTPIDTTLVEQATRRVNEAIEDSVINGAGLVVNGYSVPGLLNAPNAATFSLTAPWQTATGVQIFNDTETMIGKLQLNLKFGPYNMYVGTLIGNALDADYSVLNAQGLSIKERLLKIGVLNSIKIADQMPSTQVLLVQMTNDVVEMISGQPPTVIPWTSLDGFTLHWLVLAIMVPRVRSDYSGNSGICIGS
jgi:hypothetical protein